MIPERESDRRRRERDRAEASSLPPRRDSAAVLALQRTIGNHAVARVLARKPAPTGSTVQIHGVGEVKVKDGNLEEWAGAEVPNTVDVTSHKGRHSANLEKLSHAHAKTDVKVTIMPAGNAGEELNVGGGTVLEIQNARVADYVIADGVETWRLADFTNVHRTKISHRVA